jgi:hypothetical protein
MDNAILADADIVSDLPACTQLGFVTDAAALAYTSERPDKDVTPDLCLNGNYRRRMDLSGTRFRLVKERRNTGESELRITGPNSGTRHRTGIFQGDKDTTGLRRNDLAALKESQFVFARACKRSNSRNLNVSVTNDLGSEKPGDLSGFHASNVLVFE